MDKEDLKSINPAELYESVLRDVDGWCIKDSAGSYLLFVNKKMGPSFMRKSVTELSTRWNNKSNGLN